jgi:hypothetical protein
VLVRPGFSCAGGGGTRRSGCRLLGSPRSHGAEGARCQDAGGPLQQSALPAWCGQGRGRSVRLCGGRSVRRHRPGGLSTFRGLDAVVQRHPNLLPWLLGKLRAHSNHRLPDNVPRHYIVWKGSGKAHLNSQGCATRPPCCHNRTAQRVETA